MFVGFFCKLWVISNFASRLLSKKSREKPIAFQNDRSLPSGLI